MHYEANAQPASEANMDPPNNLLFLAPFESPWPSVACNPTYLKILDPALAVQKFEMQIKMGAS